MESVEVDQRVFFATPILLAGTLTETHRRNTMQPSSHHVVITGGAKGIGLALARKFHASGNDVAIVGRDQDALDSASASMPGLRTIRADIMTSEGRNKVVEGAGNTSVLVNNAGVQFTGQFSENLPDSIDREVSTNLLAPMHLIHRFLPILIQQSEAAIINVTSILAIVPKQSAPVYCATKAALSSFSRSLRWQLEGTPVRVLEVVPPVVDTAMTAGRGHSKMSPDDLADQVWQAYLADRHRVLAGRAGVANIIARIAPSLAERIIRPS